MGGAKMREVTIVESLRHQGPEVPNAQWATGRAHRVALHFETGEAFEFLIRANDPMPFAVGQTGILEERDGQRSFGWPDGPTYFEMQELECGVEGSVGASTEVALGAQAQVVERTGAISVEGVGPDAPTVTHANGARESLCLYALDVIPIVVRRFVARAGVIAGEVGEAQRRAIGEICVALRSSDDVNARSGVEGALRAVMDALQARLGIEQDDVAIYAGLLEIGRVLADGEVKYGDDRNWRGLLVCQHLRHSLAHLFADLVGDRSEGATGHLTRAFCRLSFAYEILAGLTMDRSCPYSAEIGEAGS